MRIRKFAAALALYPLLSFAQTSPQAPTITKVIKVHAQPSQIAEGVRGGRAFINPVNLLNAVVVSGGGGQGRAGDS